MGFPMDTDLDKDPNILAVLDGLRSSLGQLSFCINDHWQADAYAIGIASPFDPRVLIYISTDADSPERYSFELELPARPGNEFPYEVAGRGSEVTFEEILQVVKQHLDRAILVHIPPTHGRLST